MTTNHRAQDERRFDDERSVDALLAESGFPDDARLRKVLLELRALRTAQVPQPSAELAALMGPAQTEASAQDAAVVRLEDWNRKHPKTKRIVFTTLAVAASLGIAGGAAAGNDALRRQAEGTITDIVRSFSPPAAPASPLPSEAPSPGPAVVPLPAALQVDVPSPIPAPLQVDNPELPVGEQKETPQAPDAGPQGFPIPRTPSPMNGAAGNSAEAPAERPAVLPSQAGRPPAGKVDAPGNGRANGKAKAAEQDAVSPRPADVSPRGR